MPPFCLQGSDGVVVMTSREGVEGGQSRGVVTSWQSNQTLAGSKRFRLVRFDQGEKKGAGGGGGFFSI